MFALVFVFAFVFVLVFVFVFILVFAFVFAFVFMSMFMFVWMCVCVCVCVDIISVCLHVYVCVPQYTRLCLPLRSRSSLCLCSRSCWCLRLCLCSSLCLCGCVWFVFTFMFIFMFAFMFMFTLMFVFAFMFVLLFSFLYLCSCLCLRSPIPTHKAQCKRQQFVLRCCQTRCSFWLCTSRFGSRFGGFFEPLMQIDIFFSLCPAARFTDPFHGAPLAQTLLWNIKLWRFASPHTFPRSHSSWVRDEKFERYFLN